MNASLRLDVRHRSSGRSGLKSLLGGFAAASLLCVGVPALAQTADGPDAGDRYAAILKQIDDTRTNIARQELLLAGQQARIDSLNAQIASAPQLNESYLPVITRFAAAVEDIIENDIPFRTGERFDRLAGMNELLGNQDARLGEKLSRALLVAEVETTYGYEVESYDANHPMDPGRRYRACQENVESAACALTEDMEEDMENGRSIPQLELELTDGSYVRYGRLSLAYVDLGTDEMLVFDPTSGEWREARGSEEAGLRRNLRIARGEAAPDVVEAPVVKSN